MITRQQMAWIRTHGLTMCPPAPITTMPWHHLGDPRITEAELLAHAARGLPVLPMKAGKGFGDLSSSTGRMGKGRKTESVNQL